MNFQLLNFQNKKEILISIGIIFVSLLVWFLLFIYESEIVDYLLPPGKISTYHEYPVPFMLFHFYFFHGFFAALLSFVVWKNFKKALIIGITTIVIFYIGLFSLALIMDAGVVRID